MTSRDATAARWLRDHQAGAGPAEALAFFDGLPAVTPDRLTGRWRGTGLPTGSRFDGLLEAHGWYGKEFVDPETVHPLLFRDRFGRPRPVDPMPTPLGLLRAFPGLARSPLARLAFLGVRSMLFTRRPKARLRMLQHRGTVTAALVYDRLPVVDFFRRVTDDAVLGLAEMRDLPEPYFFVLRRDRSTG